MTEKKYSLKSNAMHRWLYSRKVDPVIVADRLRMRVSVFKRMIKCACFNQRQYSRSCATCLGQLNYIIYILLFKGALQICRAP